MHLDPLYRRQQSCVTCPDPPPCNCAANQDCFQINRDCLNCASIKCVARPGASNSSSGTASKGALAGAVVGSLLLVAAVVFLWLWYRRRVALATAREKTVVQKEDIPAAAETVLKRPDPIEKSTTPTTQEPDTRSAPRPDATDGAQETRFSTRSVHTNPFEDQNSIQTAGTEGTNVIPIALVPRDQSITSSTSTPSVAPSNGPSRPDRSPDLNLNLDHVNVSHESLRPLYAGSHRSGISTVSSRDSCMTGASFSSEFLNEAPVIINSQGAVRQVLNISKAEVMKAPGSVPSTPNTTDTLRVPSRTVRAGGSPLAVTSFGPSDMVKESSEEQEVTVPANPFSDEHSLNSGSPTSTIAMCPPSPLELPSPDGSARKGEGPNHPWAHAGDSRPSSMLTQAGSVAEFGNATRVYVGPTKVGKTPVSPYKTAMGRLISPQSAPLGTLKDQQQLALAHAQAQAQSQGFQNGDKRVSESSVLTSASAGGDSILESFPFVPPSPISNRPIRTPPASPLAKQSFTAHSSPTPMPQQSNTDVSKPPDPQNRKQQGMSTTSQMSTASNGLGRFTFQIDSGNDIEGGSRVESSNFGGLRQRASLDTLALTQDLSSYPLGFDRDTRDSFR